MSIIYQISFYSLKRKKVAEKCHAHSTLSNNKLCLQTLESLSLGYAMVKIA